MQQNNKKCNWPLENKEFMWMAEAWNCFHVCLDCFQALLWGWGGDIWSAERVHRFPVARQYGTTVWRRRDLFFFLLCSRFFWEWLSAQASGCIDLCCREPQRQWWKATSNSDFSIFLTAQKADKYLIEIYIKKSHHLLEILRLLWDP